MIPVFMTSGERGISPPLTIYAHFVAVKDDKSYWTNLASCVMIPRSEVIR